MSIGVGAQLGPHEILQAIGSGGMGEARRQNRASRHQAGQCDRDRGIAGENPGFRAGEAVRARA